MRRIDGAGHHVHLSCVVTEVENERIPKYKTGNKIKTPYMRDMKYSVIWHISKTQRMILSEVWYMNIIILSNTQYKTFFSNS